MSTPIEQSVPIFISMGVFVGAAIGFFFRAAFVPREKNNSYHKGWKECCAHYRKWEPEDARLIHVHGTSPFQGADYGTPRKPFTPDSK